MKKIAFLFPGQGAQYKGMGKDFFDTFAVAKHTFEEAEDMLAYKISDVIFNADEALLKKTKHSQLAIFIVSVAILRTIEQQMPEFVPYVVAGLSLGEYTALYASKKIDFPSALKLVRDRAHFMNEACEKVPGTMSAILGLDASKLQEIMEPLVDHRVWIANYNSPSQTVISGTREGIAFVELILKEAGAKRIIPLQVHGAFHSGLMQTAQEKLAPKLQRALINSSSTRIIMNVPGDFVDDSEEIKENLIKQITHSVKWEQSIDRMKKEGIDYYIEIGPGKTLAGMNKKMGLTALTKSVDRVIDLDLLINQFEELVSMT